MPAKKEAPKASPYAKMKLAAVADLLYKTREARLSVDKDSKELQDQESAMKIFFIDTLPKGEANGITGQIASVSITESPQYQAKDWGLVYEAIVAEYKKAKTTEAKLAAFRYLGRSISQEPMKELYEEGKLFPGVQRLPIKKVSVVKRAGKK
jgi:hypothetical protein